MVAASMPYMVQKMKEIMTRTVSVHHGMPEWPV